MLGHHRFGCSGHLSTIPLKTHLCGDFCCKTTKTVTPWSTMLIMETKQLPSFRFLTLLHCRDMVQQSPTRQPTANKPTGFCTKIFYPKFLVVCAASFLGSSQRLKIIREPWVGSSQRPMAACVEALAIPAADGCAALQEQAPGGAKHE